MIDTNLMLYLIDISENIRTLCVISAYISGVYSLVGAIVNFDSLTGGSCTFPHPKWIPIVLVISIIGMVFMPSNQTLIQLQTDACTNLSTIQ